MAIRERQYVELLRITRRTSPFSRYRQPLLLVYRVSKRADEHSAFKCRNHWDSWNLLDVHQLPHNAPLYATSLQTMSIPFK